MKVELTDAEYDFLRWAVKYHHWCNRLSIDVHPPCEPYLQQHKDENKVLEGMFTKFGLTQQEVDEHETDIVKWAADKATTRAARKRKAVEAPPAGEPSKAPGATAP